MCAVLVTTRPHQPLASDEIAQFGEHADFGSNG